MPIDDVFEKLTFLGYRLKFLNPESSLYPFLMEFMTKWVLTTSFSFYENRIFLTLPLIYYHSMSSHPDLNILENLLFLYFKFSEPISQQSMLKFEDENILKKLLMKLSKKYRKKQFSQILFNMIEKVLQ